MHRKYPSSAYKRGKRKPQGDRGGKNQGRIKGGTLKKPQQGNRENIGL